MNLASWLPRFLVNWLHAEIPFVPKVGDTVIVIQDCDFKCGKAVLDEAFPGLPLRVNAIYGKWLWVSNGIPGWIDREHTTSIERAIPHFTEQIRLDPNALAYAARGMVWRVAGEFDLALDDFSDAIRLDPDASYYSGRGATWLEKKDWERAIADFNEAIRLRPSHRLYLNRGLTYEGQNDYDRAIADYDEAIRLEPRAVTALHARAWLLATCPDSKYRDGNKAVADCSTACEMERWKNPRAVGCFAAAYAEIGNFNEAVKWQQLAQEMYSEPDKKLWSFLLDLYKTGKPYRQEVKE